MKRVAIVLRSGGDFSFDDVKLITHHLNKTWDSDEKLEVLCLWDKCNQEMIIDNLHIIPLQTNLPTWWSRIPLYGPAMEKYRPFLYVDLDTAIISSINNIFKLVTDDIKNGFICLEDFYQKGKLATGLAWFPVKSQKLIKVWDKFHEMQAELRLKQRMDFFLRQVITPDKYWQELTNGIKDFKPSKDSLLTELPSDTDVVCFHGFPRIPQAKNFGIDWVNTYLAV